MRPFLIILALALCVFLLPSQVVAQRGAQARPIELDVQLRNPDGSPGPAGIHIILERQGGTETDCVTVEGGKCKLMPSSTGVFTVKLNTSEYEEAPQRVELIGISHGYVTFTLRRVNRDTGLASASDAPGSTVDVADVNIPEKARQEFSKGQTALRAQKLEDGIKHFQKAIKLYDNYPQAYRMLGEVYLAQQDWKNSEDALRKSLAIDPKLAASYLDLGAVYNQQKEYPKAEEALKKGLELTPDATVGKYELAKTYWAIGRWQDAAPLASDTVKQLPDLAAAHVLLANIRLKLRDAPGALHEYQEYLRIEPQGTMALQVRDMVDKLQKALAH